MPRCARVKSFDCVYHIMVRSISDTPLFKCYQDKDVYLKLIKKYKETFLFKVYAYCIMDSVPSSSYTQLAVEGTAAIKG